MGAIIHPAPAQDHTTMTTIEKLTEEEREQICGWCTESGYEGPKALRIIDAQAAAVQALTEQVAQLTAECQEWNDEIDARLTEQVAQLTAERDEATARAQRRTAELLKATAGEVLTAREVARLTEQVAQLTAEWAAAERDVARLTEALAAAEHTVETVTELRAEAWQAYHHQKERAEAAERDRDAANALLEEACDEWNRPERWVKRAMAHLSSQPPAPSKARASSGGPCPCGDQERPGHPVGRCAEQDTKRQPAAPAPTAELDGCGDDWHPDNLSPAQERVLAAETELAALRARVAKADALLAHALVVEDNGRVARALEALRGR